MLGLQHLWHEGSVVAVPSSRGTWAQSLCRVWDPPWVRGPMSPALAGRLSTTEPPREPSTP